MNSPLDRSPYADLLASYNLLCTDLRKYYEYVHPTDTNKACYSHRGFELLLRASVDFEATAKKLAAMFKIKLPKKSNINITSLSPLFDSLNLHDNAVGIAAWQPSRRLIYPLKDWKAKPHGLYWFTAYNDVKHDRVNKFPQASLLNVVSAVGANFLLLVASGAIWTNPGKHKDYPSGHKESWYSDQDFTWHRPA